VQLLAEHRPDVVCLQETKTAPEAFPVAELAGAGYGAAHDSGGRWAGVAVLARAGMELSDTVIGLAGDFNIAPADADVYDAAAFAGSTHVTREERAKLAAIEDQGLVDAYRTLHPTEVQYTWWDYREGSFHKGLACASTSPSSPAARRRGCVPVASTASTVRGQSHPTTRLCCSISPAPATDETPQRFFTNFYAFARSLTPWRAFS
jgi:hypothetical protein